MTWTTRRCIGSLGPKGFAADLVGGGDRFSNAERPIGSRALGTATTLFLVDLEKRTARPLFTTTADNPILAHARRYPVGLRRAVHAGRYQAARLSY